MLNIDYNPFDNKNIQQDLLCMEVKMIMEIYNIVNLLMHLLNQLIADEINYIEEDYIDIINIQDDIFY